MRILIVSEDIPHPHLGGLGKHALALANELHRCGHEVDLLGNADHSIDALPEQAGPGRFISDISGHQRGWKQRSIGAFHPLANEFNARALAGAIVRHATGYDVVHYHGHLPWVAVLLPRDLPFTQTRHDQGGDCMLRTRFRAEGVRCERREPSDCAACATDIPNAAQRALSAWSVQRMRHATADAFEKRPVIFVSNFLREAFARVSARSLPGEVIHHGIDGAALRKAATTALQPPDAGRWPTEVFTVGAMFQYKGFRALLEDLAVKGLPTGWRLTLAGDGPELCSLRIAHASDQIRFLGWCDYSTVLAHMARADVVVVPSVWEEAFGSTTLEALALGRSVYALRQGGTPELGVYAGPGGNRLNLFHSMSALVDALRIHRGGSVDPMTSLQHFRGSIASMTEQVLTHYGTHFPKTLTSN